MAEEIVNRLKAEGQLIRNTGTNSIRAVRIQLDRFEDIFETISEQVTMQTQFLADLVEDSTESLRINEETREREAERRAREKLAEDKSEESSGGDDNGKGSSENEKDKESKGLFSSLKGMGITKLLMGGSLIAGGLFAGYNILKGFIDEKYDGAFTDFERGFVDVVKSVNFNSIVENFNSLSENLEKISSFLENPFNGITDIFSTLSFGMVARTIMKSPLPPHFKMGALAIAAAFFGSTGSAGDSLSAEEISNITGTPDSPVDISELSMEQRQDLIQTAQRRLREQNGQGAVAEALGSMSSQASDLGGNLDARVTSDRAFLRLMEAAGIQGLGSQEIQREEDRQASNAQRLKVEQQRSYIISPDDPDPLLAKEAAQQRARRLDSIPEYARGTKGFRDFGNASFAVLHGREAVVPEETPAGRFLNQFFNEDWTPKMSGTSDRSSRVSTVASGGMSPMIINNAPTIAPNVNNVGGSTAVNNTNVVGTGGGSNNIDPYGVPRAAN